MAKVNNPRKQFQFNIIIPGLNPFLAQEVKTPDNDFDVTEHGDTNFKVKTAGMIKLGTLTVNKLKSADTIDTFFRDWRRRIGDTRTGGGQIPSLYKTTIIVEQFAPDNFTVLERWQYSGCWPSKMNGLDFSRMGSDNTIESIEFQVDEEL